MERTPLWKRFLFPPVWLLILLVAVSGAALTLVFVNGWSETPAAYGTYALSFYALCVTGLVCGKVLPKKYKAVRQKVYDHPLGRRYMTDAAFMTHVSLFASLAVNLFYAALNILSFILYRSMWFAVLAFYYVILAVMRFLLVRYVRIHPLGANRMGELRRARTCSCILLLLNFALTGAVMMILYQNRGFEYHGVLIYIMAAYTFYITTHAIVDLVRYRKYRSPVMTVSKIIALSAALVSMLSLETAMFSQFGGHMAPEHRWLMIALTGAGVSAAVIALSVFMIVKTAKELKEIKEHE